MDDDLNNIGPSYFNQRCFELAEDKIDKKDVELAMRYFSDCYENGKEIYPDFFRFLNNIFKRYEKYKFSDEGLLKAFGFKGTKGDRKLEKRNTFISSEIIELYVEGKGKEVAKDIVGNKYDLGKSQVNEAWKNYFGDGLGLYLAGLSLENKQLSDKQKERLDKLLEPRRRKMQAIFEEEEEAARKFKNSGN